MPTSGTTREVSRRTTAHPIHHEVIVFPMTQHLRIVFFEHWAVDPRFDRRSTYSIADQPHRHTETVAQHAPHVVRHGREVRRTLGSGGHPLRRTEVLQARHGVDDRTVPLHVVGFPTRLHIIEAQSSIGSLCDVTRSVGGLSQPERHVRLSRTQPHFADSHIAISERSTSGGDGERRAVHRRERGNVYIPHTARIGHTACQFFITQTHHHRFAGVGFSFQIEGHVALQHHIVGKNRRKLQSAIAPGDAGIGHFCQDFRTSGIGMHRIGQPIGVRHQGRVEIDPFHPGNIGHLLHGLRNFFAPLARAAVKSRMINANRRQARHENAHLRIDCTQRIDESEIIGDEFVAIVRPVARIGIVDAEMHHGDIGTKLQRRAKFGLVKIRTMTATQ